MLSPRQEIERLLHIICCKTADPEIENAAERISDICLAYMNDSNFKPIPEGIDRLVFTPAELAILSKLYERAGRPCHINDLLNCTDPMDHAKDRDPRQVNIWICSIRKKLKHTPLEGKIETVGNDTGLRMLTA